jgi:hypothetical protein
MALVQVLAHAILTAMHTGSGTATIGSVTVTGPNRIRLLTATNSTSTAAGTELTTGGSYTAGNNGGISMGTNWAAASGGSQATNAVISQANMPATTITSIELWDSTATNVRQEFGNLTASKTTGAGDTLSFASGAITSALA